MGVNRTYPPHKIDRCYEVVEDDFSFQIEFGCQTVEGTPVSFLWPDVEPLTMLVDVARLLPRPISADPLSRAIAPSFFLAAVVMVEELRPLVKKRHGIKASDGLNLVLDYIQIEAE
ncbi:MAG: hypothetical protein EOO68_27425 [Moraxellaceae bacterium]|jgi:hypothetical protein|nr:MAG: hypothetical protein EOO68_27425 [Moraxellaceae bacterium]